MRPNEPNRLKPKYSRAQWAERLLPAAKIEKPDGEGPFPLVLQMHGCGGLRPFNTVYAQAALSAGYAVMTVDSFKPRGLSRLAASLTVCTGLQLHGAERAADVYALYEWARHQSWVDHDHIVFAGWSHGGWTIMDALAMGDAAPRFVKLTDLPPAPLAGLAGAVAVYPYAAIPSMTLSRGWGANKVPLYALLCGKDRVVGTRYPPLALDRLEREGIRVSRLLFPDATHAFDDEGASDPRSIYRADLRTQAADWYASALKEIRP